MARREIQEINAGSMADIAFLLLIFFLVTTTMDSDTGLMRKLPPIPDPTVEQEEQQQINQRNILEVLVNKDDLIMVEGEYIQLSELRFITKEFIENPMEDENLPEMIDKNIPPFGIVRVHKNAVISLQNDLGTTYRIYLAVQNELLAARDELKNALAMNSWGITYEDLDDDRKIAVDLYYRVPISEAEPKKTGGN